MNIENIEYIGEKIFLDEIETSDQVWVARSVHKNIYVMEFDETGVSLPVWSSQERADEFLRNARLVGPKYAPEAVSLEVFANAWLSDKMMAISELQINPDGRTTRVLCLTPEEFQADRKAK